MRMYARVARSARPVYLPSFCTRALNVGNTHREERESCCPWRPSTICAARFVELGLAAMAWIVSWATLMQALVMPALAASRGSDAAPSPRAGLTCCRCCSSCEVCVTLGRRSRQLLRHLSFYKRQFAPPLPFVCHGGCVELCVFARQRASSRCVLFCRESGAASSSLPLCRARGSTCADATKRRRVGVRVRRRRAACAVGGRGRWGERGVCPRHRPAPRCCVRTLVTALAHPARQCVC